MTKENELLKELKNQQVSEHFEESSETNTLTKKTISLQKAILGGVFLILATVLVMGVVQWNVGYTVSKLIGAVPKDTLSGSEMYELLQQSQGNQNRQIIWFDRKRIHSDAGFAKVDDLFPAQYEVWQGDKLIERWHWQVEHDKKTEQYGDYIFRCVANYDHESNYIGFTQYQMRDYPKGDASVESERLTVLDSIKFKLNITTGLVELAGPEMKVTWVMGKLNSTQKVVRGFPYKEDNLNPVNLIKTENDFAYITHLAKTFGFLNDSILKPYENKIEFIQLTENLPIKTKATWDNFVVKMETEPKKTKAFIENAWSIEIIKDVAAY